MVEKRIPWNKGRTGIYSLETLEKISKSKRGKHPSNETKQKMSISHKGKKQSEEHKKNWSKVRMGHIVLTETKKKISEANKGCIPWNKGKKGLQISWNKGKTIPDEIREKISKSKKNKNVGSDNPNWCGGLSFLPYCYKFNLKLKEQIRIRDNRTCQKCGKSEIENRKKLSVHHIHYDKQNCYPNLITLCIKCNVMANGNRDYWEEYFMEILKKRNLLNWKIKNEMEG